MVNEGHLHEGAREDLNAIVSYLERNYPAVISRFEACLEIVINELVIGPRARKKIAERPGVRGVPLIRYPYKVFYKVTDQAIEILYIHHTSRRPPWEMRAGRADLNNGDD